MEVEVRLRYATLDNPAWTWSDVLQYAMQRCLPFHLMTLNGCIPLPITPSVAEPLLADFRDKVEFVRRWKTKVLNLLQSPRSRAFLFMGGIEARIAIQMGGVEYVQRALSSPSPTLPHSMSLVVDGQEYACDTVTSGEIQLLLGTLLPHPPRRVPRSLWPSSYILKTKLPESFHEEWNSRCETLFQRVWREINSDRPQLRQITQWRVYFEFGGFANEPLPSTDSQMWLDAYKELTAGGSDQWHGTLLTNLLSSG